MNFNSRILKENTSTTNELSLNKVVNNQKDSFIYDILEFNDIMHKIEVENDINHYRYVSEYANGKCTDLVLNENIIESIRDAIAKAIQAIIDFINKFIQFIRNKFRHTMHKQATNAKEEYRKATRGGIHSNSFLNKEIELVLFVMPKANDIPEKYINGSLNNLTGLLDRLLDNENLSDVQSSIDNAKSMAYKILSKSVVRSRNTFKEPIKDSKSFRDSINADCCYTDKKYMRVKDYLDDIFNDSSDDYTSVASQKLETIKGLLSKYSKDIENKTIAMSAENRNHAMKIIGICKEIVNDAVFYFNTVGSMESKQTTYVLSLINKAKSGNVNESGTIHGEVFNGDTLFDNEDIRDFNRTEWLDLELTTECYMISSAILESKRRIAANEALIFAENPIDKFEKLVAMREAEAQKLGNRFMEIIKNIMTIIDKFFSDLRDKMSFDVNYIKKNKAYIDKPFKMQSVTSSGDILAGLKRIQEKLELKPYDYNLMKDSLSDEKEFFDKYIKSSLNIPSEKRQPVWDSNSSIADYCKAYFGASMPKDKYAECTYNKQDFENYRNNILSFLQAPNSLMQSIRAQVTNLETQAKKAAASESNTGSSTSVVAKPSESNQNAEAKNESMYYSELYNKWFTEADIKMYNESNDSNNGSPNNDSVKNEEKESKGGFKTYLNAYKSVLLSKLTGAAFIRSELMGVIKAHVKSYNPKADSGDSQPKQQSTEQPIDKK